MRSRPQTPQRRKRKHSRTAHRRSRADAPRGLRQRDINALNELFREVRLVRLFRATDALATGLAELWLESASYRGATDIVRSILDHERLTGADRDPRGCSLMSIHKAKGKEFDAVVLVEGVYKSPFFNTRREPPPYVDSRRLLRVGLTRARSLVTVLRPRGAPNLVG
jgi:DNA helicase-2/ATP-dependent DNA helicase PcrA